MLATRKSPHTGMTMRQMVRSHEGAVSPSPSSNLPAVLDPQESSRNYKIAAWLNQKNFMGNVVTRVVLPTDAPAGVSPHEAGESVQRAQADRRDQQWRQIRMGWLNVFMPDPPAESGRLNNPGMDALIKQRQLAPPNTYGQFYAFMHAMAAAFGNVQGRA